MQLHPGFSRQPAGTHARHKPQSIRSSDSALIPSRALLSTPLVLAASFFALAISLLSAEVAPAAADTHASFASVRIGGDTVDPGWELAVGLILTVADTVDPTGRIFDSPDFQRQLVLPSNGTEAFILDLPAHSVAALPGSSITWTGEELPVPDLGEASDVGGFLVEEGVIAFHVDGIEISIEPEPPLVGEMTLARLCNAKPDYVYTAGKYAPTPGVIEAIRGVKTITEIAVFFGTWCVTCKHYLPEFMKIIEEADNPSLHVKYYGVSEDYLEPKEAMRKYRNSAVPAFIVMRDGKEIGRIEDSPLDSIELDLAHILGVRP